MAGPTEAQLKDAARKALAAGNPASAKRLIEAARKAAVAAPAAPLGPQMPQDATGAALGPAMPAFAEGDSRNAVPPAPAPVEDRGMLDTIMDYGGSALDGAGYLAQETARGVTNLVGMPADILNSAPALATAPYTMLTGKPGLGTITDEVYRAVEGDYPDQSIPAVGGGQSLYDAATVPRDMLQAIMGEDVGDATTDSPALRIAGRAANEFGAAAFPVAGAIAAGGRVGVNAARQMGGPIGNFLESAAVNPVKFGAREGSMAIGAGAGAGTAREVVSDGDQSTVTPTEAAADLVGALLGGGATALGSSVAGVGQDWLGAVSGKGGGDRVKSAVAGSIGELGGAPKNEKGVMDTSGLAALMKDAPRVGDTVPGFRESTGDVLKSPGIQAMEYARQSGPSTGYYAARRKDNARAVDEAITGLAPDATPGAFSEPLAAKREVALLDAEDRAYEANTAFETAAQKLQASMTGEARGQTIRGALDEALGAARTVEREAWSAVGGEADPAPLAQAFESVTDGLKMAERRAVADLGESIGTPGTLAGEGNMDLGEVTALRSELTTKMRQAAAAGDPNQARIIEQYVKAIDAHLDGVPRLEEPLKAARAVSFDLNERFTRRGTPTADVMASRPSGGPVVPDSNVARRFVQPDEGQASNIDRILREGGSNADVQAALADEIKAGAQPLLQKPDQLDAYLKQYDGVFQKFPDLKAEIGNAASLKRAAEDAGQLQTATQNELGGVPGKAGTSPVAKYLAYGDERAVDAMSTVVNAKDPRGAIDELMSFAGNDPGTVEGARSAFWKLMERESKSKGTTTRDGEGGQTWRPASLDNFLNKPANAAVAERLYADNPEHLANLKAIAEELRGVDLRATAKAPNTSGTPQSLQGSQILPSAESLGAYGFAYQRGQVGGPYIALRIASVMGRRAQMLGRGKQFQSLLDKALLDPEVAAFLMKEYNPADLAATARSAKAYLGNRAAWVDELLVSSDSENEDDPVDTIMREQ